MVDVGTPVDHYELQTGQLGRKHNSLLAQTSHTGTHTRTRATFTHTHTHTSYLLVLQVTSTHLTAQSLNVTQSHLWDVMCIDTLKTKVCVTV